MPYDRSERKFHFLMMLYQMEKRVADCEADNSKDDAFRQEQVTFHQELADGYMQGLLEFFSQDELSKMRKELRKHVRKLT